jgi:hypothetical protein
MRHRPQRGDLSTGITSFGHDFGLFPSDCWGRRDWELVENRYQPINKMLPAAAPTRSLQGFCLFPDRQRAPETAGEKAVREIRASRIGSR